MITFKIKGITPFWGSGRPNYHSQSSATGGTCDRHEDWNACSYGEQLLRTQRPKVHTSGASFAGQADV